MISKAGDDFAYFVNVRGSVCVVTFFGSLGEKSSKVFSQCLNEVAYSESKDIIVSLQTLTGIEKSFFPNLAKFKNELRSRSCNILFCHINKDLGESLLENGVISMEEICGELTDALQKFYNLKKGKSKKGVLK